MGVLLGPLEWSIAKQGKASQSDWGLVNRVANRVFPCNEQIEFRTLWHKSRLASKRQTMKIEKLAFGLWNALEESLKLIQIPDAIGFLDTFGTFVASLSQHHLWSYHYGYHCPMCLWLSSLSSWLVSFCSRQPTAKTPWCWLRRAPTVWPFAASPSTASMHGHRKLFSNFGAESTKIYQSVGANMFMFN